MVDARVARSQASLTTLADLTTLRTGGPAAETIRVEDADALVDTVRSADAAGIALLVVGGGSNLLVADEGWPGRVVLIRTRGVDVRDEGDVVTLDAAAGEPWEELVSRCVSAGFSGIECLAGIPGLVGATPVQNVSAYGAEVATVVDTITAWDRALSRAVRLDARECGFAYRTSIFKHSERWVVQSVRLTLRRDALSAPIRYAELARTLDVAVGVRVPLREARDAVLQLRRGKGMVLDAADHDTWSAGSFFINPVLDAGQLAAFRARLGEAATSYPHWPTDGDTKLSAAWLIEQAGFHRGYAAGNAALSGKHTLALTNRGNATAADLIALARTVRDGVLRRYGVALTPEPRLVGLAL